MHHSGDLQDLVRRTEGLQPWRRLFHAANGVALAWLPGALEVPPPTLIGVLAAVLVILLSGDLVRLRVPDLNAAFFSLFRPLASPREADRVASSTWYVLGVLLAYALFPWDVAVAAILVLALADPAASTLGRLAGGRRVGKGTVQGSLAFLLVAAAVLLPVAGPAFALAVAAGVTLVEVFPWAVDDNLTIPLSAAGLLVLFGV